MEKGDYVAKVGSSSRDYKAELPFSVKRAKVVEKTHNVMLPTAELKVLKTECKCGECK